MQLVNWTDDRLDELSRRTDSGFKRCDQQFTHLRAEIAGTRDKLEGDISDLRTEVRDDIRTLHNLVVRFGIALIVGLVGIVTALLGVVLVGVPTA